MEDARVGLGAALFGLRASGKRRKLVAAGAVAALLAAGLIGLLAGGTAADAACSTNLVVCENAKTGNPASDWEITGAGDSTLQGFATDMSVNVGQPIQFKVRAEHAYTIQIFRLGWYNGAGA